MCENFEVKFGYVITAVMAEMICACAHVEKKYLAHARM